ncbi:TPA_asm: hypothetical protein [Powellomyces chytrid fungus MELD virus 4]|nr:TPA_asm: hypothetical protein [Powellomyces chytrid fungus MELD virus 4]
MPEYVKNVLQNSGKFVVGSKNYEKYIETLATTKILKTKWTKQRKQELGAIMEQHVANLYRLNPLDGKQIRRGSRDEKEMLTRISAGEYDPSRWCAARKNALYDILDLELLGFVADRMEKEKQDNIE